MQLGRSEWRLDDDNAGKWESDLGLQTYLAKQSRRIEGTWRGGWCGEEEAENCMCAEGSGGGGGCGGGQWCDDGDSEEGWEEEANAEEEEAAAAKQFPLDLRSC